MLFTGIIDVSHWEYDRLGGRIAPALAAAKAGGIDCVIAKTTQGKDYVDPSWPKFAKAIRDAGLLLGCYHFGSNTASGDVEADWFLEHVSREIPDPASVLLCLDFEPDPKVASRTMTTDQARTFVHRVHARIGQRPTIYGGSSFLGNAFRLANDPIGEFPLWIAAYGPSSPTVPAAWRDRVYEFSGRKGWTMFQYTDGPQGPRDQIMWPRETAGFGRIDRSAFNGSRDALRAWWPGR